MSLPTGIHPDVPESVYFGKGATDEPALSASIAKVLLARSPLHAWYAHPDLNPSYPPTVSASFELGTAVHDLFLRGLDDTAVVIDAPDWRTKEAQLMRDVAREQGLVPLLAKDAERVQAMDAAIRDQLAARDDDPPLFSAGKPEQTLIWRDQGVLCKARLDWLHDDLTVIDDLKSTSVSANPHDYGRRTFWSIGADVQARFYQRGLERVAWDLSRESGRPRWGGSQFRFVVVENTPPYCLSVIDLAPSAIELADQKIDTALEIWKRCLETDTWAGYPSGIASVEVGWQAQDFVERFWQDEDVAV